MCESCHKCEATVAYTRIVENTKKTVKLCSSCVPKEKVEAKGTATAMLGKKVTVEPDHQDSGGSAPTFRCPECGMTYEEFEKVGRFGCQSCYTAFDQQLERLLKRIHGTACHRGKGRVEKQEPALPQEELAQLHRDLQIAVAEEAFEQAAQLRDRIIQLEKQTGDDTSGTD